MFLILDYYDICFKLISLAPFGYLKKFLPEILSLPVVYVVLINFSESC